MYANLSNHDADTARALVDAILTNHGHTVSVYDGEAWAIRRSANRSKILEAMANTEEDKIAVFDVNGDRIGIFWLVYGNGPGELIADHSDNAYCHAIASRITNA